MAPPSCSVFAGIQQGILTTEDRLLSKGLSMGQGTKARYLSAGAMTSTTVVCALHGWRRWVQT